MTNLEKQQKPFHVKAQHIFSVGSFLMRSFELVIIIEIIPLCLSHQNINPLIIYHF